MMPYSNFERSVIRLNVMSELEPILPPTATNEQIAKAYAEIEGFPYVCFIESSGLLVLITFSGFCLKFQLEVEVTDETTVGGISPRTANREKKYAY
jgi:hypothetical protein